MLGAERIDLVGERTQRRAARGEHFAPEQVERLNPVRALVLLQDAAIAHDLLRPAFTKSAMQSYHPIMLAAAQELFDLWDTKSAPTVIRKRGNNVLVYII